MGNGVPSCILCSHVDNSANNGSLECIPELQNAEGCPRAADAEAVAIAGSPSTDETSCKDVVDVAQTLDFSDADRVLEHLESSLQTIRDLCVAGQLFDAYGALEVLEAEVDMACGQCSPNADAFHAFREQRLRGDPVIAQLRERHDGLLQSMALLSVTKRPDGCWFEVESAEHKASPGASIQVSGRWLEGSERDPKGPASQAIIVTKMSNVPLAVAQFVSVLMETDLLRPEFFQDMKSMQGVSGSRDNLYSSYQHAVMCPSLFPLLKLCSDNLCAFTVCPNPPEPLRHLGPGVLISQSSIPTGVAYHKGFKILEKPARAVRVDTSTLHYCTPSREIAGAMDITTFSKLCAPLPQSMFPLHVGAKLLLGMARGNLVRWKERLAGRFHELEGYETRTAASQEFYSAIDRLYSDSRPSEHVIAI